MYAWVFVGATMFYYVRPFDNDASMWAVSGERWYVSLNLPKWLISKLIMLIINFWSRPSIYKCRFWIYGESQMRMWIIQDIGVNKIKMKKVKKTLPFIYISKQSKVDCSQHQQGQEDAQLCCSSN